MSQGNIFVEVRDKGLFHVALLHLGEGEPETIPLGTINSALVKMHPPLEALFQDHVTSIVKVIIESMGGQIDDVIKLDMSKDGQPPSVEI